MVAPLASERKERRSAATGWAVAGSRPCGRSEQAGSETGTAVLLGFGPSKEERGKAKRPARPAEKQGRSGQKRGRVREEDFVFSFYFQNFFQRIFQMDFEFESNQASQKPQCSSTNAQSCMLTYI